MKAKRQSHVGALSIALVYAFFAGLWILLSDRAVGIVIHDPDMLVRASMIKGWCFVAATSIALYYMVARFAHALVASNLRELAFEQERKRPPPMLVAIADASVDSIFAKDEAGRYVLFNNAAARVVGKAPDEVLGKDDHALFPARLAEHLMQVDREILESGATDVREQILNTADGERVFLAIKGPLRGADGRIFGTYGISRDITERKRSEMLLHESQERLRLLVDHTPAGLAMFDRDMRYLEASRRWREDYGLGDADIIGKSHYEVFPELSQAWKQVHQRALGGETVSAGEDRYEHRDGTVQWLRWEVRPWRRDDGAVGGIVIFSEDITQRKMADTELRRRNQELEHFNQAATERELRMVALKREVNEMARVAGRPAPYDTSFADAPGA
jgi:PAS domain S-box-containing protein